MNKAQLINFHPSGGQSLLFFNEPLEIRFANKPDEVRGIIEYAEKAAFEGKWSILYLAYEAAAAFDPAYRVYESSGIPLAAMAVYSNPDLSCNSSREDVAQWISLQWSPSISNDEFTRSLEKIHEYILAGDTYQVNYTFAMEAGFSGDSRNWFQTLCKGQGCGYFAWLDFDNFTILSLSPELFFSHRSDQITMRPMKGTWKRGRWLEEDERNAELLYTSEKNRAENIMIVDMLRNDLGKIAQFNSVCVRDIFKVEKYETLLQMTSTVEAQVQPDTNLLDIMTALFPSGSITGAPKIRTMEIINELEAYPRGIYTGTIGLIAPGGDSLFNVAIRTLSLDKQSKGARYAVGSGITHDSNIQGEYEECLLKADILSHHLPPFQLFETLLLEQGEWFLFERHIRRIKDSAQYFRFDFNECLFRDTLDEFTRKKPRGRWRVRSVCDMNGAIKIEHTPLPEDSKTHWNVSIAESPIDSNDVFLFHKTTQREVYVKHRTAARGADDVLLWNERGELTESTRANIIVEIDGKRWTPSRTCGLLAGTYREELLEREKIKERIIQKSELANAASIYLINSVRKEISITLIS